jgi:hypothetical protein
MGYVSVTRRLYGCLFVWSMRSVLERICALTHVFKRGHYLLHVRLAGFRASLIKPED